MGRIKIFLIIFSIFLLGTLNSYSSEGLNIPSTDTADEALLGFFDLRDRETFIQVTNVDTDEEHTVHIQIFNVANNCNENNFFDFYTPGDSHVYNIRNIQTNDGNPSGVVLPAGAYGVFVVYKTGEDLDGDFDFIANMRLLDNNGYEYRTNMQGIVEDGSRSNQDCATFNFNTNGGITLSDIIVIPEKDLNLFGGGTDEFEIDNILEIWAAFDVDIYDLNEVPFSCRNVIFSCVNEDNPLLESLLEESGDASVASFEYGINNSIPHSKGGELLCPGNTISEGFVRINKIGQGNINLGFISFVGLNNGNGRGSLDSFWINDLTGEFCGTF